MYMKKKIALLLLLVQSMFLQAYVVKGTVVDANGHPVKKALVLGRNNVGQVVIGIETDSHGHFSSANVADSTLIIEISKDAYDTLYIHISGTSGECVDLGTVSLMKTMEVNLSEVEVTAQSVVQKPDRYIIIPTEKELKQATNGLSLLSDVQYKMPGLMVNESLQTVKVDHVTPVFKMNGKPCSLSQFLALNPQRILRIEYQENPDVKYDNRRVINVILHPGGDGGSVVTQMHGGVCANFLNGMVGVGYYNRKSEWEFSYNTNWRDYDEREISSSSLFIGRKSPVVRERSGIPGQFDYWNNILSLGYTHLPDTRTVLAAKVGMAFEDQHMGENSWFRQQYMGNWSEYTNEINRKLKYNSPHIDLFFRKQLDETQYVEANVYGRYSSGNYNRSYVDIYHDFQQNDSVESFTRDKSWRVGTDFMYAKTYKKISFHVGIQDFYNSTDTRQIENGVWEFGKISQNRLSLYGQLQGKIKRLNYGINAVGIYNHANNRSYRSDFVRLKSNFVLHYPLSKHVSLNYLLMLDPSLPSVVQQSTLIQKVDDITLKQGNPDLKPSFYIRNRIYVRYADKHFTTSLWTSYSRTKRPIYNQYSYIGDVSSPYHDWFVWRPMNGKRTDHFNLEWQVAVQELFGCFTVWGNVGWSNYHILMIDKQAVENRWFASLNGVLSLGDWLVTAKYQIQPDYPLSGNTFSTEERWNTVKVQYTYRNWHFSLSGINLFTKRGSVYENMVVSDVHPEKYSQCIRDCANMVLLGINYRFDFGKKRSKTKRSLNNGGVERGIDISY